MADLTSKLQLRRRGIAGDKKDGGAGSSSGGGVMDKISAMIPSPQSIAASPGRHSDIYADDDWDE